MALIAGEIRALLCSDSRDAFGDWTLGPNETRLLRRAAPASAAPAVASAPAAPAVRCAGACVAAVTGAPTARAGAGAGATIATDFVVFLRWLRVETMAPKALAARAAGGARRRSACYRYGHMPVCSGRCSCFVLTRVPPVHPH